MQRRRTRHLSSSARPVMIETPSQNPPSAIKAPSWRSLQGLLIAADRADLRYRIVLPQTPVPFHHLLLCPACCDLGAVPEASKHSSTASLGPRHRSIPWGLRFRHVCSHSIVSYEHVLSCPACCDLGFVLEVTPRPANRSAPCGFALSHRSPANAASLPSFAPLPGLLRFRLRPGGHSKAC